MVARCFTFGLPNSRCEVMPDPWPITATSRAFGLCARVTTGRRTCVAMSRSSGCGGPGRLGTQKKTSLHPAGLPLVGRGTKPVFLFRKTPDPVPSSPRKAPGEGAQGVEAIDDADSPLAADGPAIRH